jgi:hypothetical protein
MSFGIHERNGHFVIASRQILEPGFGDRSRPGTVEREVAAAEEVTRVGPMRRPRLAELGVTCARMRTCAGAWLTVGVTSTCNRLSPALQGAAPNKIIRTTTTTNVLRIRIGVLSQVIDICAAVLESTCHAVGVPKRSRQAQIPVPF